MCCQERTDDSVSTPNFVSTILTPAKPKPLVPPGVDRNRSRLKSESAESGIKLESEKLWVAYSHPKTLSVGISFRVVVFVFWFTDGYCKQMAASLHGPSTAPTLTDPGQLQIWMTSDYGWLRLLMIQDCSERLRTTPDDSEPLRTTPDGSRQLLTASRTYFPGSVPKFSVSMSGNYAGFMPTLLITCLRSRILIKIVFCNIFWPCFGNGAIRGPFSVLETMHIKHNISLTIIIISVTIDQFLGACMMYHDTFLYVLQCFMCYKKTAQNHPI